MDYYGLHSGTSNTDTLGSMKCVLIREVSSFQGENRGAGAGPAGPANAGPMFTPKSRNKSARSWNSNWAAAAQAVNAHAAVASSAYIALGYCEVKQL